jgi:hypothetical protein
MDARDVGSLAFSKMLPAFTDCCYFVAGFVGFLAVFSGMSV